MSEEQPAATPAGRASRVTRAGDDPPRPGGRRPPPPFRLVEVVRTDRLSARMIRVTLAGPELEGLVVEQPAASVRVLLPPFNQRPLVLPTWTGNQYVMPSGERPTIRTLTPRRVDLEALELDVDIVIHPGGAAAAWALAACPGALAAVSGPARGYSVDREAESYLLAGDETAIPAISQLLECLPADRPVLAQIEIAAPDARTQLPGRPDAMVEWLELPPRAPPGVALLAAACRTDIAADTRVWVAGEAAGVQRIRRHLFEERGLSRAHVTVRGYWKHGRSAGFADDG